MLTQFSVLKNDLPFKRHAENDLQLIAEQNVQFKNRFLENMIIKATPKKLFSIVAHFNEPFVRGTI